MYSTLAPAPPAQLWPHQTRYYQTAQKLATDLFDALDDELRPRVVLLALPATEGLATRCLEPVDCGLDLREFDGALKVARRLQQQMPWPYSERDDIAPETLRRRRDSRALRFTAQDILDGLDEGTKYRHLAGLPVLVAGYFVLTVLRFARKPYGAYPSLLPNRFYTDGKPMPSSLLDAALMRFSEESVKALSEAEPGAGFINRPRETEEVLRAAGSALLDTPAQALNLDPNTAQLFNTCNTISSLRYEGEGGVGKLLLARRGHPNLAEVFALTCPTPLTDYRAVRKLLEMTTADIHLLADGENVYALGRQTGTYEASREDLFTISFLTHYAWELQHNAHVLMRAHYGLPGLARPRLNRARFRRDLSRTFGLTDTRKIERLWEVVLEASRQKSGTILVITTEALAEADRLKLQCTLIEPVPLTPLITRLVTAIDGAVLLDPDGYCYSIGVILDGKATGNGDSARGARYNSAVRYVASSAHPCMAIVVSEDGLLDVLCGEGAG